MVGFFIKFLPNMLKPFLRRVFEHKNLKKALGGNLALMLVLGSFVPNSVIPVEAELTVIHEASGPMTTPKTVQYPLENYLITQGYSLFHPGIDLAAPFGTDTYPVKDGVVQDVSFSRYAYGNAVLVDHGDKINSLYAHLSKITVTPGQKITTLTKLGEIGRTGHATGPHLHLEIRKTGAPINPFVVLPSPVSPI